MGPKDLWVGRIWCIPFWSSPAKRIIAGYSSSAAASSSRIDRSRNGAWSTSVGMPLSLVGECWDQQKPKQPRRRGFSPGASPGVLESLPSTGRGTGATLIGARVAGVRVTPTSGFSCSVGVLRHGSEYCRCGPDTPVPPSAVAGRRRGSRRRAAFTAVGATLLGVGGALVGASVCDCSAAVLGRPH